MSEIRGQFLVGPSQNGAAARKLMEEAGRLRAQAVQKEREARALVENCKHEFDNGECSTENLGLVDVCCICGC
jgi:hypothetical protein